MPSTFKASSFKARGIKAEAAPNPDQFERPRRAGRAPITEDADGFNLQNAYKAHLNRQQNPAFGVQNQIQEQTSTPFTQGIVNARASAIEAKTGKSATTYEVPKTGYDQADADQFHSREQLAESGGTDEQFNQTLNGMTKGQNAQDDIAAKQTAFVHAKEHLPAAQQDVFEQMASDPNLSAHDYYGHLLQATAPGKAGAAKGSPDPIEQYGKYAKVLKGLTAEDTGSMDNTAKMVHQNAINDAQSAMNQLHERIVPPAPQRTPQAVDTTQPTVALGEGTLRPNMFNPRPAGGASTPPIAGLGLPSPATPASTSNSQYKMGQIIPANGKQYQVSGFDPDGHPRVREFTAPAQALPGTPANSAAAQ